MGGARAIPEPATCGLGSLRTSLVGIPFDLALPMRLPVLARSRISMKNVRHFKDGDDKSELRS